MRGDGTVSNGRLESVKGCHARRVWQDLAKIGYQRRDISGQFHNKEPPNALV